ncbi:MAG: cytochrome ubiquinol oxidase subunit I [Gammaproteobacteria bacterium]|nr:cytochrome ubiquinol oxidase subunit I [Gammaproteobacteria bacterium]
MDYPSALFLSRLQFAFTVSFHIIFPALSIGLASFLAVLEGLYLYTRQSVYRGLYLFWIKIFSLCFGLGVISGVVLSYQIGTNWSLFSDKVSNVIGPLLGFEVLTAFFLESSFLGIMLFGWGRVTEKMHFTSTLIVAFGTILSAFWILSVNSWMQTPQGFSVLADGRLIPEDWFAIVFNPSFPYRLVHMLLGAYLATAFFVGGVSSYFLLKKKCLEYSKIGLMMSILMATVVGPLQMFVGDLHGLNTFEHQPCKVAAIEGIWETEKGAGLRLIAWPNMAEEKNDFEISIPYLSSLILTHSFEGEVPGLKNWPKEDRPHVATVFYSFRIMVGIGILMVALGYWSAYAAYRKKLFECRPILWSWVAMGGSGIIAILCGWFVTEVGRQPYTVYGVLRTTHSVTPALQSPEVFWSLATFVIVYTLIFGGGMYYLFRQIQKGVPDYAH